MYWSLQVLTLKLLRATASFKWPAPAPYPTFLVAEHEVCKCSHTGAEETMHSHSTVANSIWQEYRIACRDQAKAQRILLPSNLPKYRAYVTGPFYPLPPCFLMIVTPQCTLISVFPWFGLCHLNIP